MATKNPRVADTTLRMRYNVTYVKLAQLTRDALEGKEGVTRNTYLNAIPTVQLISLGESGAVPIDLDAKALRYDFSEFTPQTYTKKLASLTWKRWERTVFDRMLKHNIVNSVKGEDGVVRITPNAVTAEIIEDPRGPTMVWLVSGDKGAPPTVRKGVTLDEKAAARAQEIIEELSPALPPDVVEAAQGAVELLKEPESPPQAPVVDLGPIAAFFQENLDIIAAAQLKVLEKLQPISKRLRVVEDGQKELREQLAALQGTLRKSVESTTTACEKMDALGSMGNTLAGVQASLQEVTTAFKDAQQDSLQSVTARVGNVVAEMGELQSLLLEVAAKKDSSNGKH